MSDDAVDTVAVQAIAAKLADVLAEPGTVHSFPLSPIAWQRDDLRFDADGGLSARQARTLAEFSELTNRVPVVGPVWRDDGTGRHLWDVYADVLGAELADSERSPEEEQRYQQARAVLMTPGADGLDHPSDVYATYRSCRNAYLTAITAARAAAGTPEAAALEAAAADALTDWTVAGNKEVVDTALLTVTTLGSKDPSVVWEGMRDQFDPTNPVEFQTGPDGSRYATTGFAPTTMMDVPWVPLSLGADELAAVAAGPTATAVGAALGTGSGSGDVHQVAFEFARVDVVRPWLQPETMFGSHGWKLADGTLLSDGAEPPSGHCPAYVTGVVFARKITVTRARPPEGTTPPRLSFVDPQLLQLVVQEGPKPVEVVQPPHAWTKRLPRRFGRLEATEPEPDPVEVGRVALDRGALNRVALNRVALNRVALNRVSLAPTGLVGARTDARRIRPDLAVSDRVGTDRVVLTEPAIRSQRAELAVVRRFDYPVRNAVLLPPKTVDPPIAPPGDIVETTPDDCVFVVAFQCRVLPLTPDPDPSLPWPT